MNFTPDQQNSQARNVPFYEDAIHANGWAGHTSKKKFETLKGEIRDAFARLGGNVTRIMQGKYQTSKHQARYGYQIDFIIENKDGSETPGRMNIAALPLKSETPNKKDGTLRMALFMTRDAINGAWYMQQLSPGFAPLMPFMLTDKGKTITELWSEGAMMRNLLPPPDGEFIDGEVREVRP